MLDTAKALPRLSAIRSRTNPRLAPANIRLTVCRMPTPTPTTSGTYDTPSPARNATEAKSSAEGTDRWKSRYLNQSKHRLPKKDKHPHGYARPPIRQSAIPARYRPESARPQNASQSLSPINRAEIQAPCKDKNKYRKPKRKSCLSPTVERAQGQIQRGTETNLHASDKRDSRNQQRSRITEQELKAAMRHTRQTDKDTH